MADGVPGGSGVETAAAPVPAAAPVDAPVRERSLARVTGLASWLVVGRPPRRRRRVVLPVHSPIVVVELVAVGAVAAGTLWRLWRTYHGFFQQWQTADWMVNYSAGFVRRGFIGEILFRVPGDPSILDVTLVVQLGFLTLLFATTAYLFVRTPRSPAWAMLLLSPAFMLFPFLNPGGALHKEIIALVALAVFAIGFRVDRFLLFAIPGSVLFALAVLGHEIAVFLLPLFLLLIAWEWRRSRRTRALAVVAGVLTAIAAVGFVITVLFPISVAQRDTICESFAARGVVCDMAAVSNLTQSTDEAISLVKGHFPAYWSFLPILALALVPLFAVRFLPRFWGFTLVFAAVLVPLFVTGLDFGRWIWVAVAALSIVAMAIWEDADLTAFDVPLYAAAAFCLGWGFFYYSDAGLWAPGVLERWLA